jgi:hypothetical protein
MHTKTKQENNLFNINSDMPQMELINDKSHTSENRFLTNLNKSDYLTIIQNNKDISIDALDEKKSR